MNNELQRRITDCLANGGLWNMEVMEVSKVRDLLIDCRHALLASSETPARVEIYPGVTISQSGPEQGAIPSETSAPAPHPDKIRTELSDEYWTLEGDSPKAAPALPLRDEQLLREAIDMIDRMTDFNRPTQMGDLRKWQDKAKRALAASEPGRETK
jgi:hypothetical protein